MRSTSILGVIAAGLLAVAVSAQDNPVPNFGMQAGNMYRTNITPAPYLFGNGSGITVKWSKSMDTDYQSGITRWGQFVFDSQGYMYVKALNVVPGLTGGPFANAGKILKINPANGQLMWAGGPNDTLVIQTYSPVVGSVADSQGRKRVYTSKMDFADPRVVALNQADGSVVWQSNPLPVPAVYNMVLYNGKLYGLTSRVNPNNRDGSGNYISSQSYVFVIDANTGAILHSTPIETWSDQANNRKGNLVLVPNAWGPGEHGLYVNIGRGQGGQALDSASLGIRVNDTTAEIKWRFSPVHINFSNVHYNAVKNTLYFMGWGDSGTTVVAMRPDAVGDPNNELQAVPLWIASRNQPAGDNPFEDQFNFGFYPTTSLKPDGSGFVGHGFSGFLWSVSDPGDQGGAYINKSNVNWTYDGSVTDIYREAQYLSTVINDTAANKQVFISGNWFGDLLHATDISNGTRLMSWSDPNGALIAGTNNQGWRSLTVGPDGTVYYVRPLVGQHANQGPQSKLYAITVAPQATISGTIQFSGRADNFPTTVDIEFLNPTTYALVHTATNVALTATGDPEVWSYTIPAGSMPGTAGNYLLSVFRVPYLRDNVGPVNTGSTQTGQNFVLASGDATGDNMVNLDDFLVLAGTYEVDPPTAPEADFTGDGLVNLDDFLILAANYETAGDPP